MPATTHRGVPRERYGASASTQQRNERPVRRGHPDPDGQRRLAGRIGGIEPGSLPPERLLETVVAAKAAGPGGAAGSRYGSGESGPHGGHGGG